jgi:hypothetical protein
MRHVHHKFLFASEIIEVDHYELGPDEVSKLPGDPSDYNVVRSDESIFACKLTGLSELIEANRFRVGK